MLGKRVLRVLVPPVNERPYGVPVAGQPGLRGGSAAEFGIGAVIPPGGRVGIADADPSQKVIDSGRLRWVSYPFAASVVIRNTSRTERSVTRPHP